MSKPLPPSRNALACGIACSNCGGDRLASARILEEVILDLGGDPTQSSGLWGSVTAAATGTARLLGSAVLLYTLQQETWISYHAYRRVLESPLPTTARRILETELVPRTLEHIAILGELRWQLT